MSRKLRVAAAQTGPVFAEDPEAMLPAVVAMMERSDGSLMTKLRGISRTKGCVPFNH